MHAAPEDAAHAAAAHAAAAHAAPPVAAGRVAAPEAAHTAAGAAEREIQSLRAEIARLLAAAGLAEGEMQSLRDEIKRLSQQQKKMKAGTFHEQLQRALKKCSDDIAEATTAAHSAYKAQRAVLVIAFKAAYLDEHN